jgi:hypothetical protein
VSNADQIAKWGDPANEHMFAYTNLATITFLGHRVQVHKGAVAAFQAVDQEMRASGITYKFSDVQTYCHRYVRGYEAQRLWSNHAFGIAVDINPATNPMRDDGVLQTDIPAAVVEVFERHGFRWLGKSTSRRKDAMHFEYTGEPATQQEVHDMTDDERKMLKQLRLSALATSHDMAILKAMLEKNFQEAAELEAKKTLEVAAERKRLGL